MKPEQPATREILFAPRTQDQDPSSGATGDRNPNHVMPVSSTMPILPDIDDCNVRAAMSTVVSAAPSAAARAAPPRADPSEGDAGLSFDTLDRFARAITARFTQGVSPYAQYAAWLDWTVHLAGAPGRQLELWLEAARAGARLARFAMHAAHEQEPDVPFRPRPRDRRFDDPAWRKLPYLYWQQAFLAQEEWWRSATRRS